MPSVTSSNGIKLWKLSVWWRRFLTKMVSNSDKRVWGEKGWSTSCCGLHPVLMYFWALYLGHRPQWEQMNKSQLTRNWPHLSMKQHTMNESVNCRRCGRRAQNQVNCNGRHGRRVTWPVSKRWVNRDLFWARAQREKRTSGPGLIKGEEEEEGRNVAYCLMWRLFSTSVPLSLPSSHSLLLLCNTSFYVLIMNILARMIYIEINNRHAKEHIHTSSSWSFALRLTFCLKTGAQS